MGDGQLDHNILILNVNRDPGVTNFLRGKLGTV